MWLRVERRGKVRKGTADGWTWTGSSLECVEEASGARKTDRGEGKGEK